MNCTSLTKIDLSKATSLETIDDAAFSGCDALTSVTLPAGLKTIEFGAFNSCDNLASVTLPQSLQTIGRSAFEGCTSLTSINIPAGVTTIERSVFFSSGLTEITFMGSNVSTLEGEDTLGNIGSAFNGASNLKTITLAGNYDQTMVKALAKSLELAANVPPPTPPKPQQHHH